jgi:hypothetical protein
LNGRNSGAMKKLILIFLNLNLINSAPLNPINFNGGAVKALSDVINVFLIRQNITNFDFLLFGQSQYHKNIDLINDVRSKLDMHSSYLRIIPEN